MKLLTISLLDTGMEIVSYLTNEPGDADCETFDNVIFVQNNERKSLDFSIKLWYNVYKKKKRRYTTMMHFYKDDNTRGFFILALVLSLILCGFLIWFVCTGEPAHSEDETAQYYALVTVVTAIDQEQDTVSCEDSNGNVWEFYGAEDWQVGDCANLLMDTMGTEKIYDDEVRGATYCNWQLIRE